MAGEGQGVVRAILWRHAHTRHPGLAGAPPDDANALVAARSFADALEAIGDAEGADALRELGRDYAALWKQTFEGLVRHLRGRPEAMADILVHEVWPYLRGGAAGSQERTPGGARIRLDEELPAPYVAGLIEGMVGLTRADVTAVHAGDGTWAVATRVAPPDRLRRLDVQLQSLRIPLLVTAGLAAAVGVAVSPAPDPWRAGAALITVVSAQAAANAAPDLSGRGIGPLGLPRPPRWWVRSQAAGSAAVALALGAWLAAQAPVLWLYAGAGAVLMLLYPRLRDRGMGPLAAAVAHGPLAAAAVASALGGPAATAAWAGVPVGLVAAAIVHLGDLADRPLDEAGGHRTLAVRVSTRRQVGIFALLLSLAALGLVATAVDVGAARAWPMVAAFGFLAAVLVLLVARHADEPARLAGVRMGTLALHVAAASAMGGML